MTKDDRCPFIVRLQLQLRKARGTTVGSAAGGFARWDYGIGDRLFCRRCCLAWRFVADLPEDRFLAGDYSE